MHITCDKGANVAALTVGVRITGKLLKHWGQGCVELYQAISDWADIVTVEEECLSQAIEATDSGWPGVFAYEVVEAVGADIRRLIKDGGVPDSRDIREWTRLGIISFMTNAENRRAVSSAYLTASDAVALAKKS